MTKRTTPGAQPLVREGDEAFAGRRDLVASLGPPPCFVRHPDAGGQCQEGATMEVYGLPFCGLHGAEVKAGALEELYADAANFLQRLDNPHVPPINPEALRVIRAGVRELTGACQEAEEAGDAALRRAYPFAGEASLRERADEETLAFDYEDPERIGPGPVDWYFPERLALHRLMRHAYEAGVVYAVEGLEDSRETIAAQLAFALADLEEKEAKRPARAGTGE